jgi:hypothetical protein
MLRTPFLLLVPLLLALGGAADGQVSVELKLGRRTFLTGESIPLQVSITNLSGNELRFQGTTDQPWIDFIVSASDGVPMSPIGDPTFGAVRLPANQTLSRSVDLNRLFPFSELGNFSIYAIVRLPGQRSSGFQSQRLLFSIATAKPSWSQVVGLPGKPGVSHEMRLVRFSADSKNLLYVQVAEPKTGRILRTHQLGEAVNLRRPTVALDASLNMHVLFIINPEFWAHARVAADGTFIGRDLYRSGPAGNPSLARLPDGSVQAVGGIFYDAEKEAAERERTRTASERPDFIDP